MTYVKRCISIADYVFQRVFLVQWVFYHWFFRSGQHIIPVYVSLRNSRVLCCKHVFIFCRVVTYIILYIVLDSHDPLYFLVPMWYILFFMALTLETSESN